MSGWTIQAETTLTSGMIGRDVAEASLSLHFLKGGRLSFRAARESMQNFPIALRRPETSLRKFCRLEDTSPGNSGHTYDCSVWTPTAGGRATRSRWQHGSMPTKLTFCKDQSGQTMCRCQTRTSTSPMAC